MPYIEIIPYQERWMTECDVIASDLASLAGPFPVRIDHLGSTSVPGLAAKDIIDLQVTVPSLDEFEPALVFSGYEASGIHRDHVPPGQLVDPLEWRKRLLRERPGDRRANIHIREAGRANQRYPLLVRDYFRATPQAAEAYARIKLALARLHPDDMGAYYEVEDPVCDFIWHAAERSATETHWSPN